MGTIIRVAGTGTPGASGDDGPATEAKLSGAGGVAVTADGGFLISDFNNHTVRRVSATGVITRVAGTGTPGTAGDDGPATEAQLFAPFGVAVTADGGFLISDFNRHTVRRVSASGVITRVAGTGTPGAAGDDGPATEAELFGPGGVAVTADGFLICDSGNNMVRQVSATGVITRVAGTGTPGATGDDGPAIDAQLQFPVGVAVTADGGFLICDSGNNMVRQVSATGVITRVAGTGTSGATGDDGPALDAQLNSPTGVAAISHGEFLICDRGNHMVRKVSATGVITRVAGTGTPGATGDDGPATDAQLNDPVEVTITADGGFLVTDDANHTVRKVLPID